MKKVFKKILISALCVLPVLAYAQNGKVQLSNESKLSINGKSNVNDFRCQSEHELQQDSLQFDYHFQEQTINVDGVTLSLEVDQFDCGKRGINRDFRSTLKYKEYPFIHITLNELVLEEATDIVPTNARVTISIAGVEQEYLVPLTAFSSSEERILVGGTKTLYMSDFGLTPPSPLLGLVQVSDELDITFDLVIKL
ncbi:MAG: YceI family protein [Balneolaceae bacterium]